MLGLAVEFVLWAGRLCTGLELGPAHRQCVSMAEPGDESSSLGTFFQPVLGLAVVQVSPGCLLGRAGTRVRVTGTASGAGIALPGAALVRARQQPLPAAR